MQVALVFLFLLLPQPQLASGGELPVDGTIGATIRDFGWMAGCWAHLGGETGSGEQWSAPAGGSMLGMSRTVRDGVTVAYEFLRISEDAGNKVILVALPSGQKMTTFRLSNLSSSKAIFENPEHDFPQKVIYRLKEDGLLVGRIEGMIDGVPRSADFPMTKVKCEAETS